MEIFSKRLKELRKERKVSLRELAKAIGVSNSSLCRWENGTSQPLLDNIKAICDYFHVTPNYLMGYELI